MKTKKTAALAMLVATALCSAALSGFMLVSCGSGGPAAQDDAALKAPPLQPAEDHQGIWESKGSDGCYGCHGADENGARKVEAAPALPEDHYAAGGISSMKIDPERDQCIICHPVG